MRLTTWDLHSILHCPKQWRNNPVITPPEMNRARAAAKEVALLHYLGKTSRPKEEIARVWDEILWREAAEPSVTRETKVSLSLSHFQDRTSRRALEAFPATLLSRWIDTEILLSSSSDFILLTERGIEAWIFWSDKREELERSIIPTAEATLINNSLRKESRMSNDIFIVPYYISENRMKPIIRNRIISHGNEKLVLSICRVAQNAHDLRLSNPYCNECKLEC